MPTWRGRPTVALGKTTPFPVRRRRSRQAYYPDGSRIFEEIDRFGIAEDGTGIWFRSWRHGFLHHATVATQGAGRRRSDRYGDGDIEPEVMGQDFFATACASRYVATSRLDGTHGQRHPDILDMAIIWEQLDPGQPAVEETLYWLNLMLDTTLPVCGNATEPAARQ